MEQAQPVRGPAPVTFQFTGSGGEYFRIWITNLLLTILTLGIYSAWAKVRRNRYFYGNTRLAGSAFDYHATPQTILRGRLLAVGAFLIYSLATHMYPASAGVFVVLFFLVLPWLVVRAMTFRARNTSYRNIRFDFAQNYRGAVGAYIGLPLLLIPTLGLIYPEVVRRQKAFIVANSRFGTTPFEFRAGSGAFYRIFVMAALLAILLVVAVAFSGRAHSLLVYASGASLYLVLIAFMGASLGNLVYNSTTLDKHALRSRLDWMKLLWIYLTNTLATIATLGLYLPWARVRLARYRAESLELLPAGDLGAFVGQTLEKVASTGEEMSEMFDVDIGL
jgi:uncharacterized membrane protein YjgN (DUF898 family)